MSLLSSRFALQFSKGPLPIGESQIYQQEGWYVWCSSLVRDSAGLFHLFYSRWPAQEGFEAWVTHSEIARATGPSLAGPFTYVGPVLTRGGDDASWDASCFHNVTVKRFGDKYYLYYMGNRGNGDWWNHRNHQRIGVAVADRPEGPWKRFDRPVLDVSPGAWDSLMVSNPTVTDTPDGRYLMIYKGVGEGPMPFGGRVLHGIAWADSPEGPFRKDPTPLFNESGVQFGFEDPFIWREGERFFCMIKDMSGYRSPSGESGLLLMQSPDGLNWEESEPLLILGKSLPWNTGTVKHYDRIERPSLFWDEETQQMSLVVAAKPQSDDELSLSLRLFYTQS